MVFDIKIYENLIESLSLKEKIFRVKTPERNRREIEGKKDSMRNRKRERKAPQQGLKAAKLDRSSLPPSHRILILMKLPVIALFSPLRPFEHEKLKKHKFQELRITV